MAIFVAGSWSGSLAEAHYAKTDPSYVVLDEEGTYNLDKVSLGTDRMYTSHFRTAKR